MTLALIAFSLLQFDTSDHNAGHGVGLLHLPLRCEPLFLLSSVTKGRCLESLSVKSGVSRRG